MSKADFAGKGEEDIVQDYNAPTRWWMVTTLFPLVAGTFGPMASAFNIMAIAIDWRLIVDPSNSESEGTKISDPKWLIAVNAVSLAIAIITNAILLAHMTNRLPFNVAMPLNIAGWFLSGMIDVGLVIAAPLAAPLPDDTLATWSQAFYYCAFSGALYVLLSIMLSVTAGFIWIAKVDSKFKLTLAQRSLMLQTIFLLSYMLLGGLVYSKIEDWIYLDAVYFTTITIFTIGFGDFVPVTHLGRSLFFPFAGGGIVFIGLIVANIRSLVLESVSVKVSTRMMEKARYKTIKTGNPSEGVYKLRGIRRRSTNGPTELERRRKEFEIMREIQRTAAHNNRIWALSMATLAFMILWFIGGVVFWQAEKATGGQNWTYFEAIYFVYVAQLTIGYGDFEPQTNSAKPAFVFWALIALPTLTVLIGAVGDAVTDGVNWAMVWFGKHMPTVISFFGLLKKVENKEKVIKTAIEKAVDEDHGLNESFSGLAKIEDGKAVPKKPENIPENVFEDLSKEAVREAYRPFYVAKAAEVVLGHLDDDTPRKYTYQEWQFLLKIIGEDEENEEAHRIVGEPLNPGVEVATPIRTEPKKQVWSWMGQESPLLSLEDNSEPKWVLKRLLEVLEKDLRHRGDRNIAKKSGRSIESLQQ
ncbi:voltage-gated potassium channel [Teratosphaeria nubilosa]|uniref:Voltage-gated potassium channel n=1 Tax=Teratosphaeria nubilosa TaxID=161662 RepID=A0A6G1LIG7_9PEZI|nr:voltage-gated potassium channel [Teratosphaeria nubilosa]